MRSAQSRKCTMRSWTERSCRSPLFYLDEGFQSRRRLREEDRRREKGFMMITRVGVEGEAGRQGHIGRRRWVDRHGIAQDHRGEVLEVEGVEEGDEEVVMDTGPGRIRGQGVGRRAEALRGHRTVDRYRGHRRQDEGMVGGILRQGEVDVVEAAAVEEEEEEEEVAAGEARVTARTEAEVLETEAGAETVDRKGGNSHKVEKTCFDCPRSDWFFHLEPRFRVILRTILSPSLKPSSTETLHPSPHPPYSQTAH
jgi:hypothetical protein